MYSVLARSRIWITFFEHSFLVTILKSVFYLVLGVAFQPACQVAQQWVLRQSRWPAGALDRQALEIIGVNTGILSI
jgi:hypothetical protein